MLPDGSIGDILVEGSRISRVAPTISLLPDEKIEVIDGTGFATIPGLINCHTHAAMTLFRGFGDDLKLQTWLEDMIWPVEAHLTPDDVYAGSRLACLEMTKSGTTAFLDMYTFPEGTAEAVEESGLRAVLSYTLFDQWNESRAKLDRERLDYYLQLFDRYSERVRLSAGPHAIYTVSGKQLQYAHDFACANNLVVHLHLSETEFEVEECKKKYGTTPVRYLHELGILSPHLVLAHALWMDDEEIQMLADAGCATVHNPASNMKLASGYRFKYDEMRQKGIRVGIGTDGCSSSNNLDMFTAMKLTSFLSKAWKGDPESAKATDVFESATKVGAEILGLEAGEVKEGMLADLLLINLSLPEMTPCHNLISNLVYSANGSAVDTMIVNGKVLMQGRHVEGEEQILEEARKVTSDLFNRSKK